MNIEERFINAVWSTTDWDGDENIILNYRLAGDGSFLSFDIFDVREYQGSQKIGQEICRRLAAAMNYCRGMTIEELENGR